MFLSHFILSQLLWFGSLFCRLEAYGSTLLWKLSFVGGMDPVTCQGLMLCGICVCAVAGGSVSLLPEVQWIVYGLCFGVFVGLLWLHAPPLITFTVVFLLLENSCGFSCTECWLECWDGSSGIDVLTSGFLSPSYSSMKKPHAHNTEDESPG